MTRAESIISGMLLSEGNILEWSGPGGGEAELLCQGVTTRRCRGEGRICVVNGKLREVGVWYL